jgi:hypothetical protein
MPSGTDLFMSWLNISIFLDIALTFSVDAINLANTHIVLSSFTVTVPCLECVFVLSSATACLLTSSQ